MFTELDHSLVRQRNEELMHEARKWHLQSTLRTNRENRLGTRPQKERPAWGMKVLALGLLERL
jgi:hypothetical protein